MLNDFLDPCPKLDEYILRGYAISAICRNCPMTDYCRMTGESCEDVKRIIAIPAANVAEVCYCSECVYHYDDGDHKCKKLRIPCPDDSEFFCKYGKKKEVNRMATDDYIKRSDAMRCKYTFEQGNGVEIEPIEAVPVSYLKNIHAADVEPVIHCKYCVHSRPEKGHEPDVHCSWWDYPMPPMGFCSKATRKKGEE